MADYSTRLNDRLVARARTIARVASGLAVLLGVLTLAGWLFNVSVLKGVYAGITMKPNAAAALVLSGASLWLVGEAPRWPRARRIGQSCAVLAGAIGAATLSQHLFGWDLGIDELLFPEEPGALATVRPGLMGPPAALCFTLAGIALLLLHERRSHDLAQLTSAVIGLVALLAITGYAYDAEPLYGVARYTGIALQMGVGLLLLSVGLLASSVEHGIASILVSDGAGSLLARRLLLFIIALPLLLGWVRILLETAGYIDPRFAVAVKMLAIIVILTALTVHTSILLNRLEEQRLAAEATVRDQLQEMETTMEVLPIGLFMATDPSAARVVGNRAAREFLRIEEPAENLSLSAPPPEAPTHFRVLQEGVEVHSEDLPVQRAAREGSTVHDFEFEAHFADGAVKHGLISALPLFDERGRPRGAVASVMDITARKLAEEEREDLLARLREAHAEAEAANRAKDHFLAVSSHELRTPLDAILGWVAVLRQGAALDPPLLERAVAAIERSAKAEAQLIDELLDVSGIIAGKLQLTVGPVDLIEVIEAATDVVRPAADAKGIELRLALDPAGSCVEGDPARLQQVMWNLLTNAVKFSDQGGLVETRLSAVGSEAVISVADEGEGISPELLPRVFDRFRQGDRSVAQRHGSLGLGLSIVHHLVEMHGGSIEPESEGVGQGATFTVRLPLRPKDSGPAAPSAPRDDLVES